MISAVILAAGSGTRLRDQLPDAPKGFLQLGDKPIIEESLQKLAEQGIHNVVIVTGYRAEFYEDLAQHYPGMVSTVHNGEYAESGSLYSLCCARNEIEPPFLLLESDIIYEPRALTELLEIEAPDAILVSTATNAGDEVYVETRNGLLTAMSKDRSKLGPQIAGELVGISKISGYLFEHLLTISKRMFEESLMQDYETDGLVRAARKIPIACPVAEGLLWAEIDDEKHLARAAETVYPLLARLDSGIV